MTQPEPPSHRNPKHRAVSRRSALGLLGAVPVAAAGVWVAGSDGWPAAAGTSHDSSPDPRPPADVFVGDVQAAMETLGRAPGVVSAIGEVYVDGRRVGHGSGGSRLLGGKGGRVPSDSRYRLASQTKAMVATTVLTLVKDGLLGVDDRLDVILPEVARDNLVEHADEITVRRLIRHTSGVPDFIASGWFDPFDFHSYHPPLELVKASRTQPRDGDVGTFRYSTTNYILLGLIIERVTRRPLPDAMAERLFRPLDMRRTYLPTRPPQGIEGPHAHGYLPDADGRPRDVDRINSSTYGVQSAVSTARDVSAFQRAFDLGTLLPAELQQILLRLGQSENSPGPTPGGTGGTTGGPGPVLSTGPASTSGGTPAPGGGPPPGICGSAVDLRPSAGSLPGLNAVTHSTKDGRIQFAISVTISVDNMAFDGSSIDHAVQAVLCPTT